MKRPAPDEKWGPLQSYFYGPEDSTPDRPTEALFFHGNGFSALTYNGLLHRLAAGRTIRAFDLQGHGSSDEIDDLRRVRGWHLYRDNIAMALERNQGGVLIGHSMGAVSSLFTALKHPERVKALVLLEPVFLTSLQTLALGLSQVLGLEGRGNRLIPQARARRAVFADEAEAVAYFLGRKGLKTWPEAAIRDYAASILRPRRDGESGLELSLKPDWEAQNFAGVPGWVWPSKILPMPVFIAYGQHVTSTVSQDRLSWLRRLAPNLTEAAHPEAGHMLPVDTADWTAEQVGRFLDAQVSAAP